MTNADTLSLTPKLDLGPGWGKRIEQVREFTKKARDADVFTFGSVRVKKEMGNIGVNHHMDEDGVTINALGVPSEGEEYCDEHFPEMMELTRVAGMELAVSIQPDKDGDITRLTKLCDRHQVPIIELNAGCPNLWVEGAQKLPMAYEKEPLYRGIHEMLNVSGSAKGKRVKLVVYLPRIPDFVFEIFRDIPGLVPVFCNTFSNSYMLREDGRPAIDYGKHYGGSAGPGLRPVTAGHVAQMHEALPDCYIVAIGGVSRGRHMWGHIQAGASEVGLTSAFYFTEDYRIFRKIKEEYLDLQGQTEQSQP